LNHSKEEEANVISYRVLTSEGVVILLIAKKAIKKGEELTYCYNRNEVKFLNSIEDPNIKSFME
jgi:hypothetical protein